MEDEERYSRFLASELTHIGAMTLCKLTREADNRNFLLLGGF